MPIYMPIYLVSDVKLLVVDVVIVTVRFQNVYDFFKVQFDAVAYRLHAPYSYINTSHWNKRSLSFICLN